MESASHLARARLLIGQRRWQLAEQELRLALAESPNESAAHALLAVCLSERKDYAAATAEAEVAVHLAPDDAYPHYVLSIVLFRRNCFADAEVAIREALRIDPFEPEYFGWLAQTCFAQRRWDDTLHAAEEGLALDGEQATCINLRAMALVKLGRAEAAGLAIQSALERNPENAYSHANLGWVLLEQRQPQPALEHFREALRIDPDLDWARRGMIEAMKARFLLYRWMLAFFLRMNRLSSSGQSYVVIGGFIAYRLLVSVADANPALAPWLTPLIVAYIAFAVLTWLAVPLFNFALRLSRFGRLALSREEIRTSDLVGCSLLGTVILIVAFLIFDRSYLLLGSLMCGLMAIPFSRIYDCDVGWPRTTIVICTWGLVVVAALAVLLLVVGEHRFVGDVGDFFLGLGMMAFYGFAGAMFVMQFFTMVLVRATPRR